MATLQEQRSLRSLKHHTALEIATEYASFGLRPVPVCDPEHKHVSAGHRQGFQRPDGSVSQPCASPGKAPLEKGYPRFADQVPTNADLHRMFGKHKGNIGGVVPNGLIVLDVDLRSGGLDSIEAFVRFYGTLPFTPTVLTGGGGFHYYFELPEGVTIPKGGSLAVSGYPGVEWKGPGAQVILPPSVHSSGRSYRWEPGCEIDEVPPSPIPQPLLDLIVANSGANCLI